MKHIYRACSASRRRIELALLLCGIAAAALGGCVSIGPKPWEHDLMAEPAMHVNAYPLQSAVDDHIYFSKEASSGGRSYAGGGCGCN